MKKNSILLKKALLKPLMVEDNKVCLSRSNGKSNFSGPTIAYSDAGDKYWKTVPRKYDEHLHLFFTEYVKSSKHIQSNKNKQQVK